MKKKLLFLIPFVGLITSLVLSLNMNFHKANAAYDNKVVFNDIFDEAELNERWETSGDVSLKHNYSSMRINPQSYDWNTIVTLNQVLSGDYKVRMDLSTHKRGGWFAIAFGADSYGAAFAYEKAGFAFYDDNTSELLDYQGRELKPEEGILNGSAFGNKLDTRRIIEISVNKIDEDKSSIQCEIFESGASLGKLFDTPHVAKASLDGYMSFNSNLKSVEIYSIEVLDGLNNQIYYDDFSSSSVLYPSSGSSTAMWHTNKFSEEELKVGYVNSLYLKDVGSGITYVNPINEVDDKNLSIAYVLEAEIQYMIMDLDMESGIEIAKKDKDSQGYFFGLRKANFGYSIVAYSEDEEQTLTCLDEDASMSATLTIIIYQNKDIAFKCGDLEIDLTLESYAGYIGLFTRNKLNNRPNGSGGYFNRFTLNKENYYKRDTCDFYNNFNGVKKTYFEATDEYAYDYYISKSEWNLGTNVALSKWNKSDNGNGRLEFNSSTLTSSFGPKKQFHDFVVKFDVQINSNPAPFGGILGLEFGNSRTGLFYENTKSLGIGYYQSEGKYVTVPVITNMEYAPHASNIFVDGSGEMMDIFKDNGRFTLMYVARNNTVSLYFVLEGENETSLSKLRTQVVCKEGQSTDGYLAVFGAGSLSFSIDNLSIINLDLDAPSTEYNGTSDYQEVTRLDFSSSESINGLNANNASYSSKKYRINADGEMKTNKLVNDFILRLGIKDIEDTLLINQDSLNVKFVNKSDKYIEVDDGVNIKTYELDKSFEFRNSLLELEKIGTSLNVRLNSGDSPLSKFEESVISFNIEKTNDSVLTIKSLNGFVDLSSFTFINLNRYVTIMSRDYNEETDNFDPWSVKPPIDGESSKKGCGGDMTISSLLIAFAAFILLFGVYKLRRREE